jgi:RNase H-fold protein (predicted Holliday junction resolvase)
MNEKYYKSIVGAKTLNVWVDMLKELVPHGRTHRISVIVAGMLTYMHASACKKRNKNSTHFLELIECYYEMPEETQSELLAVIEAIFKLAKVRYKKVNSRGQSYSIAGDALYEFINWEEMPWRS